MSLRLSIPRLLLVRCNCSRVMRRDQQYSGIGEVKSGDTQEETEKMNAE